MVFTYEEIIESIQDGIEFGLKETNIVKDLEKLLDESLQIFYHKVTF